MGRSTGHAAYLTATSTLKAGPSLVKTLPIGQHFCLRGANPHLENSSKSLTNYTVVLSLYMRLCCIVGILKSFRLKHVGNEISCRL